MVREEMCHLSMLRNAGTFASFAEPNGTSPNRECLRALACDALAELRQSVRTGAHEAACAASIDLPSEHVLFPDVLPARAKAEVSHRLARVRLSDAARRIVAAYGRAQTAFERSQAQAMSADMAVAEAQVVLDVLSPHDPQYARASHKRQTALAQATAAAAQADRCYRWVRESGIESWVRYLARLPDFSQISEMRQDSGPVGKRSRSDFRSLQARATSGGRRTAGPRLAFIPAARLADRRSTRFRGSEGGNSMTQAAMQAEMDEGRVTSAIWDAVVAGASLKDIHGIPSETMDGLYAHAYDFYSNGQLAQAEAFFRFLCIYDFYNPEYIVGLAAVCQLKEEYQKAVDLYAMAFAVGKNDYRPVFYAGQCQMMMRNMPLARECFGLVCESSSDADLRTKAKAYLDAIGADDIKDKAPGAKEAA
ncbi:type III secretion system translocator chaperone SicA [Pandoraea sputorum]|uniref:Chaperone protein SicA n=1 Tax=Pandoraea sputorum TaxID=93222 RepID=A0A5E5ALG9_9BURK|nr:type III secretion system translocator chaperone SicA [Pandoraea sputorum]VVE74118.1 Chaperone protein SicA [Pandoraea sputorum]